VVEGEARILRVEALLARPRERGSAHTALAQALLNTMVDCLAIMKEHKAQIEAEVKERKAQIEAELKAQIKSGPLVIKLRHYAAFLSAVVLAVLTVTSHVAGWW
jgi:hypothetical protein